MTAKTITGNESFWGTIKLSADAIALINASPTLVMELLDYSNAVGVTAGTMGIDTGTGTGTGWNGSAIFFAQNWNTLPTTTIVGQLAHEIGHFENATADIAFDDEYRPAATDQSITADDVRAMMGLHREGEAAYNNWVVQQEILKATSSDGSGKGGTEIYLAGDGVYSTGPSNLQSILDTQHTSDVSGKLTASQEKNAMIEDAMHVFAPLPTSEDGTSYYNYYMKVNGAANPAQAPALGASGITFNDPNENGNFTTMGDTFSSGQSVTQSFSGSSLLTSVTKDQFGNVLTQTTYSHNADGSYIASQVDHLFNANGTQTAYAFNAAGHETEQATFGTNGKITQDFVFDGASGRELQETDYNTDGSGVAHAFNPDGTQNAAVFDPSGHVSEYATYGANGKMTTDAYYNSNGRETQLNEYSGNQTTVHVINADNSQTATVYNSSGHETEYAEFNTSGHKTDDYFFDGTTGRETEYDQYGNNSSMTAHLFNSDNTQNAIIFNGNGQELEYDSFDSSGKLTGFTEFTYGAGGGYDAVAYGPTGYETGWADYANNNALISSGGGQYNFTLGNEYDGGSDDFDFGSFEEDMGYSADFGFSF
ncbi:hypothetical protein [Caballeronia sp. M23-90]